MSMKININKDVSIETCLNDCDNDDLDNIYKENSFPKRDKPKTRRGIINYLVRELPLNFEKSLRKGLDYSAYKALKGLEDYDNNLAKRGLMFVERDEEKHSYNFVIPKEIKEVFFKYMKKNEEKYLYNKLKEYISTYLVINGAIPKKKLKELVKKNCDFKFNDTMFDKCIKELGLIDYKDYFSIVPDSSIEDLINLKEDWEYKNISLEEADKYMKEVYNKVLTDIEKCVNKKQRDDNLDNILRSTIFVTPKYIDGVDKILEEILNIPKKEAIKANIEASGYKSGIRYWIYNGNSLLEINEKAYLKDGILDSKPNPITIKSCLKKISNKVLENMKDVYEYKGTSIDKLSKIIKNSLEELDDLYLDMLTDSLSYNTQQFKNTSEIPKEVFVTLILGYAYLYKDSGKITYVATEELEHKISEYINEQYPDYDDLDDELDEEEYLDDEDDPTDLEIYVNRYVRDNGIIEIDKLYDLIKNSNNVYTTKKEIREIAEEQGLTVEGTNYLTVVPFLTPEERTSLIAIKKLFGKYHVVNLSEADFTEAFLYDTIPIIDSLNERDQRIISSYFILPLFTGAYKKSSLEKVVKEKHSKIDVNKLDKIAKDYKDKIRLWNLNGYKVNENKKGK